MNRFTKVDVEALLPEDLQGVVNARFPLLAENLVNSIVKFNSMI